MSRLIKKPVMIASGVTVTQSGDMLVFKGPKGEERVSIPANVSVSVKGEELAVVSAGGGDSAAVAAGTMWALARNAVRGVTGGYEKILEIEGVGYRAAVEGKDIVLHLGYALPVRFPIPAGVAVAVEKNTIKVSGVNKELVGRIAAEIRSLKKPEPYKGKGIHYAGEVIRRKVGKKAGATGAAA